MAQQPRWSGLPLAAVTPRGTDNALYRLGADMVVRLPRHAVSVPSLEKELAYLPRLAARLPVDVPRPLAAGAPAAGYPFVWAVFSWIPGDPATPERLVDGGTAAADLARFIHGLWRLDAWDGPPPAGRGGPLAPRRDAVRRAVATLGGRIDAAALLAVWEDALAAPAWTGPGVWIHGDLDARNVLAREGRIRAVVDFGSMAVGDPACDVMVAWKMVPARHRAELRKLLGVDEATWRRARGWAVSQALIALGYYTEETNAVLVDEAGRWLDEVLAEVGHA